LTTPDPVTWQAALRRLADAGTQVVALEASSIGLQEHRLDATRIRVAVYTNFTQDHLDYHGSMDDYWLAKRRLFAWPGLQAAVIYMGDDKAHALAEFCQQRGLATWTCAMDAPARLQALNMQWLATGMQLRVRENDPVSGAMLAELPLHLPLLGTFNVANVLGVIGALRALGVSLDNAVNACTRLTAVPGRMQMVAASQTASQTAPQTAVPLAVVDYAHTPDALKNALMALRPVAQARGGKLWCVFGCGGSRDALKRPLMGAVASQYADQVVLTSDNPRNESPGLILAQILAGIAQQDSVAVIERRAEAIDHALLTAANEDVILLAGKGHETTQEVAGVKTPFDDAQVARSALERRLAA
jgi:MurE/MurF fusion protein